MSSQPETTHAAIPARTRAALALITLAGLVALALDRPGLPAMPWQQLQPTRIELARQLILLIVWLVLAAICLRIGWLALKATHRLQTSDDEPPCWLPSPRQAHTVARTSESQQLLKLFSRPPAPLTAPTTEQAVAREAVVEEVDGWVAVELLGSVRIAGELVRERATRGLVVYLLLKRAPATMDELAEALWPGETIGKTRQRLWKAKRQAQRLLGDALHREPDGYALDHKCVRTDLDELERLRSHGRLRADELERAFRLAQAEPLAEVDYPWSDSERRRLQAVQAELLDRIAGARLEQQDPTGALAAAERLIQLDPLNERGWCLAMEADGQLGNREAVIGLYETLRQQLDERLGLQPSAEAKRIYRRLLSQQ